MKEYIVEFGDALYNEETGKAVFNLIVNGELIRCKDCKWQGDDEHCPACNSCGRGSLPSGDWYCAGGERKES